MARALKPAPAWRAGAVLGPGVQVAAGQLVEAGARLYPNEHVEGE